MFVYIDSQHIEKHVNALMNVGVNRCISTDKQFTTPKLNSSGVLRRMKLTPCSASQTGHSDGFSVEESEFNGHFLQIAETSNYSRNSTQKSCLYTGFGRLDTLWSDLCDLWNEWQGWDLEKLDEYNTNDEFFLYHKASDRCAMAIRGEIRFSTLCNQNNKKMIWKFIPLNNDTRTQVALQMKTNILIGYM